MGPGPRRAELRSHRSLELQDGDAGRVVGVHPDLLAGDVLPDRVGQLPGVGEVDGMRGTLEQHDRDLRRQVGQGPADVLPRRAQRVLAADHDHHRDRHGHEALVGGELGHLVEELDRADHPVAQVVGGRDREQRRRLDQAVTGHLDQGLGQGPVVRTAGEPHHHGLRHLLGGLVDQLGGDGAAQRVAHDHGLLDAQGVHEVVQRGAELLDAQRLLRLGAAAEPGKIWDVDPEGVGEATRRRQQVGPEIAKPCWWIIGGASTGPPTR